LIAAELIEDLRQFWFEWMNVSRRQARFLRTTAPLFRDLVRIEIR